MTVKSQPFFSVILFTKNRPAQARQALLSVLRQSFEDFEVVVNDNDDTDATRAELSTISDPRVQYCSTGGKLSMNDNWELGFNRAKGSYVLSLTDRMVLKSYALARVHSEIQRHSEDIYMWSYNSCVHTDSMDYVDWKRRDRGSTVVESETLFDLFLTTPYGVYSDRLPKGSNGCYSASLLNEIRLSTGGRLCLPVSPDYTLAFLALAHRKRVVEIKDPLFVWGSHHLSNGGGLYTLTETFQRFINDLGITLEDLYRHVPLKTGGIHNSICNDLLVLKERMPDRFGHVELKPVPYFVVCKAEIRQWLSEDDPRYHEKMTAWEDALSKQPQPVIDAVRNQLEIQQAAPSFQDKIRIQLNDARGKLGMCRNTVFEKLGIYPQQPQKFASVLDCAKWIEESERRMYDASVEYGPSERFQQTGKGI